MRVKESKANARFDELKRRVKRLVLTRASEEDLERINKLPESEKQEALKQRRRDSFIFGLVTGCIIIALCIPLVNMVTNNKQGVSDSNISEQTKKVIYGREFKRNEEVLNYLHDDLNQINMNIAISYLSDSITYSTTYANDNIPEGKYLEYSKYYSEEVFTTAFLNGYPNVSYEQMGLESDLEAYAATQLAMYEIMSREGYLSSRGTFAISKVSSVDEEHKEKTEKIKAAAQAIVDKSFNETYADTTELKIDMSDMKSEQSGESFLRGPFKVDFKLDDTIHSKIEQNDFKMDIKLVGYKGEMNIVSSDGTKYESIPADQDFYYQTSSKEQPYFGWLIYSVKYKGFSTRLYTVIGGGNYKNYIILNEKPKEIKKFVAIDIKTGSASVDINFRKKNGEVFTGAKYRIYDNEGNMVLDIDGSYVSGDAIAMPLGKYYIEQYESIDGFFPNQNKFDFELTEKNSAVAVNILNESIE